MSELVVRKLKHITSNRVVDLDNMVKAFDSVADMKAAVNLVVGEKVRTFGYYTPGDGGGNDYEIVAAATGTDDGGSFIDLTGISGQAKGLFVDGRISVKQFGAKGDKVTDDTSSIQAAYDYSASKQLGIIPLENSPTQGYLNSASKTGVHFPSGKYKLTATVVSGGNIISSADRAYVFSTTATFPLFTVSTVNTEWSGFIFDGGTYHLFFSSTARTEAAVTHVHDCEFRSAYEYCIGDDISVHYNYPMIVRVTNCKSYGSSFAYLHNNGTYISNCWIGWDVGHESTADNPLFDCSNPFVLENITEVPFGTNTNKTPRIASVSGRSLSLTCRNVRFGGEATQTPIISTDTDEVGGFDCDLEFIGCSMFGVANFYWAEFYNSMPRRISVTNCQGVNRGGFVNCLGARVSTTTNPLDYIHGTLLNMGQDVPAVASRFIVTDDRTSGSIPTGATPADFVFSPRVRFDESLSLKNYDIGNGFTLFLAPYVTTGNAAPSGSINDIGFAFNKYIFEEPNENVKITVPGLAPSGGAGIYSAAIWVIPQNGSCTFNGGYERSTGSPGPIEVASDLCEVGYNRVGFKFYYDGTNPVDIFFNISSVASVGNTEVGIGGIVINKGDTVGNFVPANSTTEPQANKIAYGNAAPVDGKWTRGSIVYDSSPSAGSYIGWVCVADGTPGTWKTFGAISA